MDIRERNVVVGGADYGLCRRSETSRAAGDNAAWSVNHPLIREQSSFETGGVRYRGQV